MRTLTMLAVLFALSGCVFKDVREQQALLDAACVIEGTASVASGKANPIVVVLGRRATDAEAATRPWRLVDHFVLEEAGRWAFVAPPGDYRLGAFEDASRDLVYQHGESFVDTGTTKTYACKNGTRVKDVALALPATPAARFEIEVDVAALQARNLQDQADKTLGQLTVTGEITKLTEPRFAHEVSEGGLWRPFDFIVDSYAGVYFLERDDPKKIPVLFVHGMNGTPLTFDYLIRNLDRTRFQPWVYYYPSGLHLAGIADHLTQTIAKLEARYPHAQMAVVAHSMGGLVSRGFIQRHAEAGSRTRIPLFVTLSTPWGGHRAAEIGVKRAPAVVRVWEDMAPGSSYQKSVLAKPLPPGTVHHLAFTYRRKSGSFGASDDEAVTVASQLEPAAQAAATRLYGFDDTHIGIFTNADASALVNRLLADVK